MNLFVVFAWDCPHCETTLEANTQGELSVTARKHLTTAHPTDLADRFASRLAGQRCRGGCGLRFEDALESPADFVCPECGHDNLASELGQAVWVGIEKR